MRMFSIGTRSRSPFSISIYIYTYVLRADIKKFYNDHTNLSTLGLITSISSLRRRP